MSKDRQTCVLNLAITLGNLSKAHLENADDDTFDALLEQVRAEIARYHYVEDDLFEAEDETEEVDLPHMHEAYRAVQRRLDIEHNRKLHLVEDEKIDLHDAIVTINDYADVLFEEALGRNMTEKEEEWVEELCATRYSIDY